jgi:CheY-like chemotaxis protein
MLSMTLRDEGWDVTEVDSYVTALAAVAQDTGFDAILADIWMPEPDMEALAALRAAVPGAVLCVMSSLDPSHAAELVSGVEGIHKVLSKGVPPQELVTALAG